MKPALLPVILTALQRSELKEIIKNIQDQPDIPAASICTAAGWSFNKLNAAIKTETGFSMKQFMRKAAMQKAAYLLRNTHKPIKEIAAICGYKHGRSFHRRFIQHYQCTPARYRR